MALLVRTVLLCLLAAVGTAATELTTAQQIERPYEGYLWLDIDGVPLPFQSRNDLERALRKAKVKKVTRLGTGVTQPSRLLLKKGDVWFHAVFKDVDVEEKNVRRTVGGKERHFRSWRDSFKYDIAAYQLDVLLGLDRVPPSVRRGMRGRRGAATIWLAGTISEAKRREMGAEPPDLAQWNQQQQIKLLFENLAADRDANLGNTLIDTNWRLWFIDCSRCFGTSDELLNPNAITHCERTAWEALQDLNLDDAKDALGSTLGRYEIEALLARRDRLVDLIQERIDRWGEQHVLFDLPPSPGDAPWGRD